MKGTGNGSMFMNINTLGKFQMTGDFIVDNGEYLFRYGSLINKKFTVKNGGTISWEGDPLGAKINFDSLNEKDLTSIELPPNTAINWGGMPSYLFIQFFKIGISIDNEEKFNSSN